MDYVRYLSTTSFHGASNLAADCAFPRVPSCVVRGTPNRQVIPDTYWEVSVCLFGAWHNFWADLVGQQNLGVTLRLISQMN